MTNNYKLTLEEYKTIIKRKKVSLFLKRLFDIILSILLLVLFSPILLIFAIWIKLDSKGPVFYRQERVTMNGKIFRIFKYRTMVVDADKKGSLVTLANDDRITKVGKLIRKIRLDELPQLINVLLGDMTFVGTRPEVKKYVDCYSEEMKATLLMRAGITSIASIEFKDEDEIIQSFMNQGLTIDEIYVQKVLPKKMEYNLEYIKKFSFLYDIKIMLLTAIKVLK